MVLPAYPTEVTEETTTVGYHLGKSDLLHKEHLISRESKSSLQNRVALLTRVCRALARRPSHFQTLTYLSLSPRKASLALMSKPHHHQWLDLAVIYSPTQRRHEPRLGIRQTRCDSCPLAAVPPWKTASSLTWLCKPGIRRIILLTLDKKGRCKRGSL